jgi:hypothetical protein
MLVYQRVVQLFVQWIQNDSKGPGSKFAKKHAALDLRLDLLSISQRPQGSFLAKITKAGRRPQLETVFSVSSSLSRPGEKKHAHIE